ncbi:unnamed protein product [Nippostrongylus brasiliensis]|uniref:MFS domain-containing protein n=1 Tax=Nippostrongylus brasiliensis TaxID=27835 RepID=A0A0N4XFV9_NIPBR|nr:unnamed protein product [Nippostrongylus brasiliensis]
MTSVKSLKHVHMKYCRQLEQRSDWKNIYVLDPTLSASFIGLIMAVSGIGEAVAAPILGYWTNCSGKIVPPLIASVGLSIVGNALYMCLNEVPLGWRTYALLLSRFLNGAGSGKLYHLFSVEYTTQKCQKMG